MKKKQRREQVVYRQQHTESSRLMRGAWKAVYEYILELRPQRDLSITVSVSSRRRRYGARYSAWVFIQIPAETGGVSCL